MGTIKKKYLVGNETININQSTIDFVDHENNERNVAINDNQFVLAMCNRSKSFDSRI